jgi:hypothetical protein
MPNALRAPAIVVVGEGIDECVVAIGHCLHLARLEFADHGHVIVLRMQPRMRMRQQAEIAVLLERGLEREPPPHHRAVADIEQVVLANHRAGVDTRGVSGG